MWFKTSEVPSTIWPFHLVAVGIEAGELRQEKLQGIQFPILHSPNGYEAKKRRCIQGALPKAIEAIDNLKPYKDNSKCEFSAYLPHCGL
jgi:hypothetical protein